MDDWDHVERSDLKTNNPDVDDFSLPKNKKKFLLWPGDEDDEETPERLPGRRREPDLSFLYARVERTSDEHVEEKPQPQTTGKKDPIMSVFDGFARGERKDGASSLKSRVLPSITVRLGENLKLFSSVDETEVTEGGRNIMGILKSPFWSQELAATHGYALWGLTKLTHEFIMKRPDNNEFRGFGLKFAFLEVFGDLATKESPDSQFAKLIDKFALPSILMEGIEKNKLTTTVVSNPHKTVKNEIAKLLGGYDYQREENSKGRTGEHQPRLKAAEEILAAVQISDANPFLVEIDRTKLPSPTCYPANAAIAYAEERWYGGDKMSKPQRTILELQAKAVQQSGEPSGDALFRPNLLNPCSLKSRGAKDSYTIRGQRLNPQNLVLFVVLAAAQAISKVPKDGDVSEDKEGAFIQYGVHQKTLWGRCRAFVKKFAKGKGSIYLVRDIKHELLDNSPSTWTWMMSLIIYPSLSGEVRFINKTPVSYSSFFLLRLLTFVEATWNQWSEWELIPDAAVDWDGIFGGSQRPLKRVKVDEEMGSFDDSAYRRSILERKMQEWRERQQEESDYQTPSSQVIEDDDTVDDDEDKSIDDSSVPANGMFETRWLRRTWSCSEEDSDRTE